MPRTYLLVLALALVACPPSAFAEECEGLLLGYNIFETLEEGKVKEQYSTTEILDWADATAFKGVVTKAEAEDLSLEVKLGKGKAREFSFTPWEKNYSFRHAEGFEAKKFFKNAKAGTPFILRLKEKAEVVCELSGKVEGE